MSDNDNKFIGRISVKQRQIGITIAIFLVIFTGFLYIAYSINKQEESSQALAALEQKQKLETIPIETPGNKVNPEEVWRYKVEGEHETLKENIKSVKETLESELSSAKDVYSKEMESLKAQISELEQKLLQAWEQANTNADSNYHGAEASMVKPVKSIIKTSLNLGSKSASNVSNTIAAGTFVKAILLGGVDASTNMSASSDPRPILLRIIDHGTLPRNFQSDLKDCHVIASSYGDISSERIYARLEKLSCTNRRDGEIIETSARGYIAGEDGRVGVRGIVVSKDFHLLQSSLSLGLLSGIGKTLTPQAQVMNPFAETNKYIKGPSVSDQFKQGFGDGTSSGLDRLSRYYIDKAEQVQPVVQVDSGRIVDIVFTEGVRFGNNKVVDGGRQNDEKN